MAVLGRLLVSSAERLDLPDLLSIDSYAAGDWKYFLKGLVGDSKPYILKGFDVIDPTNAIGTQSCSIRVADSVTFYPGSSAGSFYHGLPEGHLQAVPLVPELRKNAVNYVYLTFSTFNTSIDTRAFWDPDKDGGVGGEFTQDVNTESVLEVQVNVSTGSFPANTVPVAKITVGPVVITAIEDARDLMFRLGSGGVSPDPFNTYGWRSLPGSGFTRTEPPTNMQAGGVNPFQGADKNILTLKEWMDAVMSKLRELGGTTYWYDDTSSFGIVSNFFDAVATVYKSKGQWIHSSATPGLLTWTEDIQIKLASDLRSYIIRAGNKTLANEQVMYIPMVRNALFNPTDEAVSWTNGQAYINTVGGAVGLFANLTKGDFVRKANDSIDKWLRVEEFYDAINLGGSVTTAALARSVRLSAVYAGTTIIEKGRYDKGAYLASDVVVSSRDSATIANTGGNFHWLALRSDTIDSVGSLVSHTLSLAISEHDGATAKVVSAAHGLVDGDRITISGTTNFNGTFKVEVETANIFYITQTGGPFANESGSGFFATVTTVARVNAYGFQEESANHGFRSDDTIIIAGTTNYNSSNLINVTGATTFTIPIPSAFATESTGTATLARIIVRDEGAGVALIQGQIIDIGGSVADNIRQYVGMGSLSETSPQYAITPGYNTLDGMQNYNGVVGENLTSRVSKLTAMMADKAQDKTILLLHQGYSAMTNTTSGANQLVTFVPDGNPPPTLNVLMPGSPFNGTVGLTGTLTLAANEAAYFMVDRNNAFSYANLAAVTVAAISSVPIEENVFILAARFSGNDIWLWDGSRIPGNSTVPSPEYAGAFAELIGGGTVTNTFNPTSGSPHLNDASAQQAQIDALAAYTDLAGRTPTTNYSGIDLGTLTLTPGVYKWNTSAQLTGTVTLDAAFDPDAVWIFQIGSTLTTASASSVNIINGGDAKNVFWQVGSSATLGTTTNFKGTIIAQVSITSTTGANTVNGRLLALTGAVTLDTNSVTVPLATTAPLAPVLATAAQYAVLANSTVTNTGNSIITGELGVSPGTSVTGFPPGIIIGGGGVPQLTFTAPFYLEKAGLDYTDNTIPISESPIVFPNDLDVAYVIPNLSPGGPLLTVVVGALSTVPTNAVIIARREGNDIIVGTSMRLVPLESGMLYSGISDQLLVYIGAPNAGDSTPAYVNLPNGLAPYPVAQGASLTLAIDQTMGNVNSILTTLDQPSYDEFREIVASSPTGNQLLFPVPNGTIIDLPVNSRLTGSPQQYYIVGKGALEIFLNGQILQLGEAGGWTEVGTPLTASMQIQINQDLVVGDFLTFRIDATGGPGSGGAGAPDDNFFTLPTSVTPDNADYVLTYDTSANAYRKQTRATFLSGIGGFLNVNTYAVNTTADINNDDVILVNAAGGNVTIALPAASTADGKIFYIKKVDATGNQVIIDANGSELIDGALTVNTVVQYESFTITSDGTNWWIL